MTVRMTRRDLMALAATAALTGTARARLVSHAFDFSAHFSGFVKGDSSTPNSSPIVNPPVD